MTLLTSRNNETVVSASASASAASSSEDDDDDDDEVITTEKLVKLIIKVGERVGCVRNKDGGDYIKEPQRKKQKAKAKS